jgi:hypothetical protein
MTIMKEFRLIVIAWLLIGQSASAGSMMLGLSIEPEVTAANSLVVTISNNAKEGDKTFDAVEVGLGGSVETPACRMVLPPVTLSPSQKRSVKIASTAILSRCMGWPVAVTLDRLRRRLVLTEVESTLRGPGVEEQVERFAGRQETATEADSRLVRLVARSRSRDGLLSEAVMLLELR